MGRVRGCGRSWGGSGGVVGHGSQTIHQHISTGFDITKGAAVPGGLKP